jgi:flagellar L-ring protein precursor FlgH
MKGRYGKRQEGNQRFRVAVFFWVWVVALAGCAANIKEAPLPEKMAVQEIAPEPEMPARQEGSLWHDRGLLSNLFMDQKARTVGDIVTIRVAESATASNEAATKSQRTSSMAAGIDNFFNLEQRYPPSEAFFNPFSKVEAALESGFDGGGSTTRSGSLSTYITARVTQVLPNGNLKILGTREVKINNEAQTIALTGIIRPKDISPDNVILSTYVSDAKIEYAGVGVINDRQRPGWLGRLFDVAWPF